MPCNITVIGAGLAGCEAAFAAAESGVSVKLYDMKPGKKSPAHHSEDFGELVCSNSLRAAGLNNAAGMLKAEMRLLGSLIMESADKNSVPAGGALAVDREGFSRYITDRIKKHPLIEFVSGEIKQLPESGVCVVATGPLTSEALSENIQKKLGLGYLYFYDAAAPIVTVDSIDMDNAFFASRYDKGTPDYINCPMTKEEYTAFYRELINAKAAQLKEFDREELKVFEGCMPVEEMAKRGEETLLFGNLKPVGLRDKEGKTPYAVVQLRQDNAAKTLYNLVGFQTHLTFGEQNRVFRMIPALREAEFVRYGVMHRNTFINSPECLDETFALRNDRRLFFAGQLTGVEGYIESAASGMVAGLNAARLALGEPPLILPGITAMGALGRYVSSPNQNFQPMNINYGIIDAAGIKIKGKAQKNEFISNRGIGYIKENTDKIKVRSGSDENSN